MTRVKRGVAAHKRHKRLLKQTKGFWGQRANIFKRARETLFRALAFAYKGRRLKKRDMRGLFITRIKAGAELNGMSYNRFVHGLKQAHVGLNRKMLSQIAALDPAVFAKIAALSQSTQQGA